LEIVRAADAFTTVPPKSPSEHHEQDKIQKTTTVVISKHTLDTNPTTPTTPAALPIGAAPLLPPESATVAQTQTQQQQQQQQQVCILTHVFVKVFQVHVCMSIPVCLCESV